MKKCIKLLAMAFLCSLLTMSCKSNSDVLKDATKAVNQLSEQLNKVSKAEELQSIALKYDKIINSLQEKLGDIEEDELMKIEGAEEFIDAISSFAMISADVSTKIAGSMIEDYGSFLNSMSDIVSDFDDLGEDEDEDEEYDDEDEDDDDDEEYEEDEEDEDEDAAPNQLDEEIERYEKLVNKFISNQKNGMDILSNLSTYEKAQDAELELADKTDRMSSKQQNKYYALMKKLSNAYLFGKHD